MKYLIIITCLLQAVFAAPQLISFKDGKVGVNILGYHAEAGLDGGLHASAGTPWGQNAAAGLGGNVNGRAAGVLYAGAQATPDVGAGAILGGDTSQGGFSGAEAYANGKVSSHTRTIAVGNVEKTYDTDNYPQYPPLQPPTENVNAIQKIRPPKKYHASEPPETNEANGQSKSNQPNKPVASISVTKTIKTTAPAISKTAVKLLIDIDANVNKHYKYLASNGFSTTPSASFALTDTPSIILSSESLSQSLNAENSNGSNFAKGVGVDNNPAVIIITRERTKLRTHNRKHRRNHQQKRINTNRQRQISKTLVKAAVQQLQQQHTEDILPQPQNVPQIYQQQQQQTRRQLIAPPPPPPPHHHELIATPCDSHKQECNNVNREVRSDVVQSALQIPIGILQSLQQSLGNLRSH